LICLNMLKYLSSDGSCTLNIFPVRAHVVLLAILSDRSCTLAVWYHYIYRLSLHVHGTLYPLLSVSIHPCLSSHPQSRWARKGQYRLLLGPTIGLTPQQSRSSCRRTRVCRGLVRGFAEGLVVIMPTCGYLEVGQHITT
jgi:hypothetical protein